VALAGIELVVVMLGERGAKEGRTELVVLVDC
jgi:hypothetical protein